MDNSILELYRMGLENSREQTRDFVPFLPEKTGRNLAIPHKTHDGAGVGSVMCYEKNGKMDRFQMTRKVQVMGESSMADSIIQFSSSGLKTAVKGRQYFLAKAVPH